MIISCPGILTTSLPHPPADDAGMKRSACIIFTSAACDGVSPSVKDFDNCPHRRWVLIRPTGLMRTGKVLWERAMDSSEGAG